jgi:hypothetical protein
VSLSLGVRVGKNPCSRERFTSLARLDAHALPSCRDLEEAHGLPSRTSTDEFPSIQGNRKLRSPARRSDSRVTVRVPAPRRRTASITRRTWRRDGR